MTGPAPSPSSALATGPGTKQFTTVHALRGIAALWVVLFHAFKFRALAGSSLENWPNLTQWLFEYGRGGVAIFFVISGFVIAHSLRDARPDASSVGLFMVRRSIRLDPPYWMSMIVAVAAGFGLAATKGVPFVPPSPVIVVAHIFYLQELLRLPEIMVVFWTLTYEIQFYFMFMLALWWWYRWRSASAATWLANVVPAALLAAAFIAAVQTGEWATHGLFLNYWHAFAAGCLAYAGGVRRSRVGAALTLLLTAVMLMSAPRTAEVFNSPAALTAIGLLAAGRFGGLSRGLNARFAQFLGTISYSLYLLHLPTLQLVTPILVRLFGRGEVVTLATFTLAIGACLAVAALFWRLVELPTHRLARRVGSRRSGAALSTGDKADSPRSTPVRR